MERDAKLTIIIPGTLYEWLLRKARKNNRTDKQEIVDILRKECEPKPEQKKSPRSAAPTELASQG